MASILNIAISLAVIACPNCTNPSFKQPMDSDKLHFLLFEPVDKLVMQVETSCITAMYHFSRLGYISFFLEKKVFDCVGCMEWDNRWVVLAVAFASFSRMRTCL